MGRAAVGLTSGTYDRALQAVAAPALDLVEDGDTVGFGSCRAAATFIARRGESVRPFGLGPVWRRVKALGLLPVVRRDRERRPYLAENSNLTLDCALSEPLGDGQVMRELERVLLAIPSVVATGLFLGTAERVLVGYPDGRVGELRPLGP